MTAIIIGIIFSGIGFVIYCCCVVAGRADRQMEKYYSDMRQ